MDYYGYNYYNSRGGDIMDTLMKPVGPLPLVAWVGIGAGALVLIIVVAVMMSRKKKAASKPSPKPAVKSGGSPPPPPAPKPKPKPVDCVQSSWSRCSKPCGGGTQSRTITVDPANGGKACGPSSQACNTQKCTPVDCEMSSWTTCNKTCGGGKQTRVILRDPKYGGKACGPTSKACNTQACKTAGGTQAVQMCCPWSMRQCPKAGYDMTCAEFRNCWKKGGWCPCAGETWFKKCGW